MAEPQKSIIPHVQRIEAGAHVVAASFPDDIPALALSDGMILLGAEGGFSRVAAHPDGAVLVATCDGKRVITGGDDGKVVATYASGHTKAVADEKGRWIDAVTTRGEAIAWSAGKTARALDAAGALKSWSAPTTVRGLCFLSKGYRLALAHYNGVSLWVPMSRRSRRCWNGRVRISM